ncbi:hypothetical protein G4Y73_10385 [Wenzhouxiangella sp. XN201]|uniref:hypothetical protein n=1 Tax=Wenzhouxiangella sp. XN201 TaxID=2710755 RepID=UPI0013CC4415|nr:hypothetical protein [Wenzhouxiangella sp. XN201]NEZ04556.1 hypothetical protein [Wenzhouxiangella sp. XN201]
MPLPDAASRARLTELGIDLWVLRSRARPASQAEPEVAQPRHAESVSGLSPRLRLASGDGDWLLVQDSPWDGRHGRLLDDIQAAIGTGRCRFGQWAHSDSAGVGVDQLETRGIRRVLAFGDVPGRNLPDTVLVAPGLDQLATAADARKHLWQLLSAELES